MTAGSSRLTGERRMPGWYTAARDAGGPIWTEGRTLRSGTRGSPGRHLRHSHLRQGPATRRRHDGRLRHQRHLALSQLQPDRKGGLCLHHREDGRREIPGPRPPAAGDPHPRGQGRAGALAVRVYGLAETERREGRALHGKILARQRGISGPRSQDVPFQRRRCGLFRELPPDGRKGPAGLGHRPCHPLPRDHGGRGSKQPGDHADRDRGLFPDPDLECLDLRPRLEAPASDRPGFGSHRPLRARGPAPRALADPGSGPADGGHARHEAGPALLRQVRAGRSRPARSSPRAARPSWAARRLPSPSSLPTSPISRRSRRASSPRPSWISSANTSRR